MGWLQRIFGLELMDDEEKKKAMTMKMESLKRDIAIRELAFDICVNRIAKAVSKCEFRTYQKKKEIKKDLYYLLNVEPNPNQNATEFWEEVIYKYYHEKEVLIFPQRVGGKDCLYIADSFNVDDTKVLRESVFKDVSIRGLKLNRQFRAHEVFYFKMTNQKVVDLLDDITKLYTDLIKLTYANVKQNAGLKLKLKISDYRQNNEDEIKEILNEDVKAFLEGTNSVFPEYDGYLLEKVSGGTGTVDSTGIKKLIDDVLEITSKAFLIPSNIATGEVTDTSKAVDDFLTFCLDSIVELISDELNRKQFTPEEYLSGTKIRINTQTIKHIDVLDMASGIDKLLSSGVKTINDINRILGDEEIAEEWANRHFMTKNYSTIDELLKPVEDDKVESQ